MIPKITPEIWQVDKNIRRLILLTLTLNNHKESHEIWISRERKHTRWNPEFDKIWSCDIWKSCQWYQKELSTFSRGILRVQPGTLYSPPKKIHNSLLSGDSSLLHYSSFSRGVVDLPLNETSMCVPVPVESIQGVAGQRTILPCNIQPRESNDAVSMVLWFKEDSGEPLYR